MERDAKGNKIEKKREKESCGEKKKRGCIREYERE